MDAEQNDFMALKEAAKSLGCSVDFLLVQIDKGAITAIEKPWRNGKFSYQITGAELNKISGYLEKKRAYQKIKRSFQQHGKSRQVAEYWIKQRQAEGKPPDVIYAEAEIYLLNEISVGNIVGAGVNQSDIAKEHNRFSRALNKDIQDRVNANTAWRSAPKELRGVDRFRRKLDDAAESLNWDSEKTFRMQEIVLFIDNTGAKFGRRLPVGLSRHVRQTPEFDGCSLENEWRDVQALYQKVKDRRECK